MNRKWWGKGCKHGGSRELLLLVTVSVLVGCKGCVLQGGCSARCFTERFLCPSHPGGCSARCFTEHFLCPSHPGGYSARCFTEHFLCPSHPGGCSARCFTEHFLCPSHPGGCSARCFTEHFLCPSQFTSGWMFCKVFCWTLVLSITSRWMLYKVFHWTLLLSVTSGWMFSARCFTERFFCSFVHHTRVDVLQSVLLNTSFVHYIRVDVSLNTSFVHHIRVDVSLNTSFVHHIRVDVLQGVLLNAFFVYHIWVDVLCKVCYQTFLLSITPGWMFCKVFYCTLLLSITSGWMLSARCFTEHFFCPSHVSTAGGYFPVAINDWNVCIWHALFLVEQRNNLTGCLFCWHCIAAEAFLNIHWSGEHYLVVTWLVLCETAAIVQTYTGWVYSVYFIPSHLGRVHVCLGVTCHLHFWQNDQDLLCATAMIQGWIEYWNESQHRKLTMEKEKFQNLSRWPFNYKSRSGVLSHCAIPAPHIIDKSGIA